MTFTIDPLLDDVDRAWLSLVPDVVLRAQSREDYWREYRPLREFCALDVLMEARVIARLLNRVLVRGRKEHALRADMVKQLWNGVSPAPAVRLTDIVASHVLRHISGSIDEYPEVTDYIIPALRLILHSDESWISRDGDSTMQSFLTELIKIPVTRVPICVAYMPLVAYDALAMAVGRDHASHMVEASAPSFIPDYAPDLQDARKALYDGLFAYHDHEWDVSAGRVSHELIGHWYGIDAAERDDWRAPARLTTTSFGTPLLEIDHAPIYPPLS